jgi:hypothetical protein
MSGKSRWRLRSPYETARGWLRGLLITLAATGFLAYAGAFGSGDIPLGKRIPYWLTLTLVGWLWGAIIAGQVFPSSDSRLPLWGRVVLVALTMSAPYTLFVAFVSQRVFHDHFPLGAYPGLFLSVLAVALALTSLNVVFGRAQVTSAAPAGAPPPKFLERLPLKLRGAAVWAVEAEDHYLRLHTSKGQDLILMRLSDAVAELEGIEGAQVHRSWWVARDAIADARRGDGRATLTLKDGAEVPVSRTYARTLRETGWI